MTLPYALPNQLVPPSIEQLDRRVAWLLLLGPLLVYGYFFGGHGYNQNAQFDSIRAIVERGTFEITPYARPGGPFTFTGDVYDVDGRVFSNKPPGMTIVGAPIYAILALFERALGLDLDALNVMRFNAYVLTLCLSAFPGAWVVAMLFRHLREQGVALQHASLAAAAFAFGTLLFPYATVLMSHNLLAACLFVPWVWVTRSTVSVPRAALAGLLVAIGMLSFLPVAPLALLYLIHLLRRGFRRQAVAFCVGPALAVGAMLAHNAYYFGSPFETGARVGREPFYEEHLLLGKFAWPDWRRLYWITFHPFRGLFYCCPVFILCLLSLLQPTRAWLRQLVTPALVVAFFVLFYLTFNGWAGGFSVGPRYAIPALPFLFLFAVPALARYRTIAIILIALSTLNMLAVTGYNVMVPGNSVGGAMAENPVAECYKRLTMNSVARNSESFNLGLLIGINGVASLLPAAALIGAVFYLLRLFTRERRLSLSSAPLR
ncbi:MAG TPA: hypothetical protein VGR35_14050 [Tepidisphaeraceae bacterium]|nr:hypothetical protein [Tepidisphaeraceae bacterium]